ncbi:zinc metallopeptidase [Ahrensia sp. R2A130]|uniref:zinc metallopeptidase n=1 Tax=Ahrensia sp. R2A130 TaxID=744979 RepID=UPI0001E0C369|nr:zinc metallopeptidase [Ahrensia sp. R2A130]EFL88779.1 Zn-dependent protease [Ahrensia sp. R2A130]
MLLVGIIGVVLVGFLISGPQLWVKRQMRQHSADRPDLPGTGAELAEHLIKHFGVTGVTVEQTDAGDHYDSEAKAVRLTQQNYEGRSLTAVAVAAHEVGHAMQDHNGEAGLKRRHRMVKFAMATDKIASIFFLAAPVLGLLARTPAAFIGFAAIGIALLAVRILVHLVTLPVEYDASFGKALPILKEGGYLADSDLPAARSVLKAAALTYVSAAVMSLIDLARWIRILR